MTKQFINAVTAAIFTLCFAVTAMAENCVPMARKGGIPNPSVLADNIEVSLQADPSGNGQVAGANISPNGFLKAVQGAGGTVTSVDFLPTYLRSLAEGAMPQRETYSRVCKNAGGGEYYVDTESGFTREARVGEVGWYDTNTDYMILAGDCSNSPLRIVQREPVVAHRLLGARRAVYAPQQVHTCPGGDPTRRYFAVMMYEPKAATLQCATNHMLPHGGKLGTLREGEAGAGPTEWGGPDAFSLNCGPEFRRMAEVDYTLKFGTENHDIEIVVVDGDQEFLVFRGTVRGDTISPATAEAAAVLAEDGKSIFIPEIYQDGWLAVHFLNYSNVRTPVQSGLAHRLSVYEEMGTQSCNRLIYSGIDMPQADQVASAE